MRTELAEPSMGEARGQVLMDATKAKLLALVEVLAVYAVTEILLRFWSSTAIVQWEKQHLGWSYSGMAILLGIPAVAMWLARRSWAEYGVSLANWRTNVDTGLKAYLLAFLPMVFGLGGAQTLGLDTNQVSGGLFVALTEAIGLVIMIWILRRQKPRQSGRWNLMITFLLLLLPVGVALVMGKFSVVIVSTVVWQFVLSGFGEEFAYRGYYQSRLNQAFGRPVRLSGIQFGAGLIIASLLFGLRHAFNTYDPAIGASSISWGWALWTFVAGLFFGVIREKTGTLVAPGIAHGLPEAVGEALTKILGSM